MRLVRNLAFVALIGAAVFANTRPAMAMPYDCVTMQPHCCGVLEAAIQDFCGTGGYWMDSCCENCGWDGDHCCAEWACTG
jgi:hypothetical protein